MTTTSWPAADTAPAEELAALRRRLDRERRARLEAETVAEHATRQLYDALAELTEAEARARIVSETAAQIFGSVLEESATLEAITDSSRRALRARRATCYVLSEDGESVDAVHTTESDEHEIARLHARRGRRAQQLPLWVRLVATNDPLVVAQDCGPTRRDGAGRIIGMRLEHASVQRHGRRAVLGVLLLELATDGEVPVAERTAARSFAGLASLALANARLHEQTLASLAVAEQRASCDPLTGLANRRAFQERMCAAMEHATRHGRELSLALLDLDHFKLVNDLHGHQVGDAVLVAVAGTLSGHAREGDLVARVGGEEFAWVMPDTAEAQAWQAAERAREIVAGVVFDGVGPMTVSGGVCGSARASDEDRLYSLTDAALYRAKREGRNRIVRFTPELAETRGRADRLTA